MTTIEIDFDLYKQLTVMRRDETDTYSDVIRRLMQATKQPSAATGEAAEESRLPPYAGAWIVKGIQFPPGTLFRATYKGKSYSGVVRESALEIDGKSFNSPSDAAKHVTGTNVNGWRFWECKRPGENWTPIDRLRT